MTSLTKVLRPYQVRLVTDVCRATGDVLVEQPTGSGKTVQIVTLVAMHLGKRFSHAVIAAPQEQIEQGFVKRDYQMIAFPNAPGVAVTTLQVPKALIKGARESRLGSVKRVIHYLRQQGPLDHAFACTHAALNQLKPEQLPDNLSGKALFIDEAHHASADGLSQIVTLWSERGGQLFFFTATPYRGDGRPVLLEGMKSFRRSLAEHMAEGFAPKQLESEIVALGQPGDVISGGVLSGEEALPTSYIEPTVSAIVRRWEEDRRPKAIIRVPPMQGGKSGALVSRLTNALTAEGARVLDATGTGQRDKQRFLAALEAEKNRTYATSGFDVMVGIQRVLEGTDWPLCSAVYCVGMPGSLNTVVQFLGRAMRLKGADYPAAQRDRARLAFFVPCAGGTALADLSLDHSRHALLTCCFLADHEVGQEWIVLKEVRRGIEAALGPRAQNPAAADAENEADAALDPAIRAEVELAITAAKEQIISTGGEPTLGEVVRLTAQSRPDLPVPTLHRVATEVLAAQATPTGTAVRDAIHREVARRLRIDPRIKEAMAAAFALVLDEFRTATLQNSVVLESVGRQIHGVTGGQMRQFAQRLRDAAPRPLTEELILAWADAHFERTREWPKKETGTVFDAPDETWRNIDAALCRGNRGLPKSSLPQMLAAHRGVRNKQDLPILNEELILAWADAHHNRTGEWPLSTSEIVIDSPDEKWAFIDAALRTGLRGLPGSSSLPQLLEEKRGVRNLKNLSRLTLEQVLAWLDAHKEQTGNWPQRPYGPVLNAPGETWLGIENSLRRGDRGLPASYSIAQLLADHRGVRNTGNLQELTVEQILAWADEHHTRTGKWPKLYSGVIPGTCGETWTTVNTALSTGIRGLPGRCSLAKLLAKERNARSHLLLSRLSVAQVLAWADAHHNRTGQWPTTESGPIQEAVGESWKNVGAALVQGLRGLPGGFSLAQLLAQERGVRNPAATPSLTEKKILQWIKSHYELTEKWPHQTAGPIADAPGETWTAVEIALSRGRRGLPGGSSLAKLLAKHFGVRNQAGLPPLSIPQILTWVDAHHHRTGNWPQSRSGEIDNTCGETWQAVEQALRKGHRSLPGGSSLARLIKEHRGPLRNE